MHGNKGPTEGIEPPETPPTALNFLGAMRDAARDSVAKDRRERLITSIFDGLVLLNPFDGEDVAEDELDGDALVVARYVTTLASAFDHYIETGDVIVGADPLGHLKST